MKSFLVKSVLAVCITVFCIFYLDIMYEQKSDNPIAEVNAFNFVPETIQLANFGSSHGQYAFDWGTLKDRGIKCFNFALASQSFKYDYALLNMHKNEFAEGSIAFIPVSYFSFNSEATNPDDIEAISVRYYRILSPQYNPDYSLYKDLVAIRFPILSAGDKIFDLFKPPVTFPSLSDNRQNIVYAEESSPDVPAQDENAGTPETDTSTDLSSEAPVAAENMEQVYGTEKVQEFQSKGAARYQRHFEGKSEYFEEDKEQDLKDMIELCQERNITPILITTPFSIYYNQYVSADFMNEFYSKIQGIAAEYGITYYDYSHDERFQTHLQYFGDADHLNEEGAIYFTDMLTKEIPELKAYLETH